MLIKANSMLYHPYIEFMTPCYLLLTFTRTLHIYIYTNSTDASDFQYVNQRSPPGFLSLSPNTTQQCVNIAILDDSEMEETEFLTLSLSLTSEQNSVALSQPNATVYIIDNDGELYTCI